MRNLKESVLTSLGGAGVVEPVDDELGDRVRPKSLLEDGLYKEKKQFKFITTQYVFISQLGP